MHSAIDLIRYACRSLWNNPGFTVAAVLTLALGIGANTAIFSIVEAVVLAPLSYAAPDRLVVVRQNSLTLKRDMSVSYPDSLEWRAARSFQNIAFVLWQPYNLTGPGETEHINGKRVTAGFFATLGVKLALGREFSSQEDRPGGAPVAILSHRLWKTRFASSPNVIGKTVTLEGSSYTITGVAPATFRLFGSEADVYTPLGQADPILITDRTIHAGLICIARLKPGVTLAQADAEMATLQGHLNQLYPAADRGLGADVVPLKQEISGDLGKTLLLLLGAVGLVLLIACANVANLLLARSVTRSREFAVRLALGADRAHIVWQSLAESLVLSLAGGAFGLLLAQLLFPVIRALIAADLPFGEKVGLNIPVLLFTFAVSIAAGVLFGLSPAFKSANTDLQFSLKRNGHGCVPPDRRRTPYIFGWQARFRARFARVSQERNSRGYATGHLPAQRAIIGVQIALTLVLLTGAGLLLRTIDKLSRVNPGFNPQHILTFKVGLTASITRTGESARTTYGS